MHFLPLLLQCEGVYHPHFRYFDPTVPLPLPPLLTGNYISVLFYDWTIPNSSSRNLSGVAINIPSVWFLCFFSCDMRHQHSAHSRAAVSNQLVNEWNDSLFSLPLFCILYLDICRVIDDDDMWYAPPWLLYTVYVAPRVFICCLLFCDERVCVTALWQPVWASLRKWFPVGDIYLIVLSVDCCPYVVNETVTVYPFPLSPYPPILCSVC